MTTQSYWLYMVQCSDGTLYSGITTDVNRRVQEHNASNLGAKYTQARRPVQLVYARVYSGRSAASKAEAHLKKLTREQKQALIARAE